MVVTKTFDVELTQNSIPMFMDAVQGDIDSRCIRYELHQNGLSFNVPTNASVRISYRKPDGTTGVYSIKGNNDNAYRLYTSAIEIDLVEDILSQSGAVIVEPALYDADGTKITFWHTIVRVEPRVPQEQSTTGVAYNTFEDDLATQTARINMMLDKGEGTPDELKDIRVGYNGKSYDSAGDAVRNQMKTLRQRIEDTEFKLNRNLLNIDNCRKGYTIWVDTALKDGHPVYNETTAKIISSDLLTLYKGTSYYFRLCYTKNGKILLWDFDGNVLGTIKMSDTAVGEGAWWEYTYTPTEDCYCAVSFSYAYGRYLDSVVYNSTEVDVFHLDPDERYVRDIKTSTHEIYTSEFKRWDYEKDDTKKVQRAVDYIIQHYKQFDTLVVDEWLLINGSVYIYPRVDGVNDSFPFIMRGKYPQVRDCGDKLSMTKPYVRCGFYSDTSYKGDQVPMFIVGRPADATKYKHTMIIKGVEIRQLVFINYQYDNSAHACIENRNCISLYRCTPVLEDLYFSGFYRCILVNRTNKYGSVNEDNYIEEGLFHNITMDKIGDYGMYLNNGDNIKVDMVWCLMNSKTGRSVIYGNLLRGFLFSRVTIGNSELLPETFEMFHIQNSLGRIENAYVERFGGKGIFAAIKTNSTVKILSCYIRFDFGTFLQVQNGCRVDVDTLQINQVESPPLMVKFVGTQSEAILTDEEGDIYEDGILVYEKDFKCLVNIRNFIIRNKKLEHIYPEKMTEGMGLFTINNLFTGYKEANNGIYIDDVDNVVGSYENGQIKITPFHMKLLNMDTSILRKGYREYISGIIW